MENEIWKEVVGYEGFYQVSSTGVIKSLSRMTKMPSGKMREEKETILSAYKNPKGYCSVALSANSRKRAVNIHTIVAEAFLGPRENGKVVDHIDMNKHNNNAENLRYVTFEENTRFAIKNKRRVRESVATKYSQRKWRADMSAFGKTYHLGSWATREMAEYVYITTFNEFFGYLPWGDSIPTMPIEGKPVRVGLVRGVTEMKKTKHSPQRYRADMFISGKRYFLGSYESRELAQSIYRETHLEFFGTEPY